MDSMEVTTLFCLPNELLLRALIGFRTNELLPLTCVSRRFHDLVLRILRGRMLSATEMSAHKLILECYHPASKNIEPYLFCDYLGTPGLTDIGFGRMTVMDVSPNNDQGCLGQLADLYSHFRPIRLEEEHRIFTPMSASEQIRRRMIPASDQPSAVSVDASAEPTDPGKPIFVERNINLDVDEPFSQLCVVTNLVRPGPRRGVFFNFVGVSDGVIRVKRDWLAKRAAASKAGVLEDQESRTLWLDNARTVGIRVQVEERAWTRAAPVLMLRDEDPAATYRLQYEELLVKTTRLLLSLEEAAVKERERSGNGRAMIFGTFVRSA